MTTVALLNSAPTPGAVPPAEAACLYCGSAELEPLYHGVRDRLGFVPGDRAFWECARCGSAVLVPLPATSELPGFYPPVYSFTPDMGGASPFKRALSRAEYRFFYGPLYAAQARRVMRACGWARGEGKRLLDVGCGRGLLLQEFRRLGFDAHGLDVQPDVVRHVRDHLSIPAECADISSLGEIYPPGSFDLITTFYLMEHIPDVHAAMAGIFHLLKPGGWMTAAVPFVDCLQAAAFGARWIHVAEAPRHLSLPTQRGMTEACRAAGFVRTAILPDSTLNCAGQIASSLISGATLTHVYGQSRLRPLLARAVGAGVMLAALPWCVIENHVLRRVSGGVVAAQKPAAA